MNADSLQEQQILEQATAAVDASEAELASEAQSLREGWLVFGQLLESVASPAPPRPERPTTAHRTGRRVVLAVVASAACVLICLGIARRWNDATSAGDASPVAVAENAAQPAVVAQQPSTATAANETAWDDSLDEQIAQVGQNMIALHPTWSDRSSAFDAVQYELQQVEQEIDGEKL
jgi:hypothetical protein